MGGESTPINSANSSNQSAFYSEASKQLFLIKQKKFKKLATSGVILFIIFLILFFFVLLFTTSTNSSTVSTSIVCWAPSTSSLFDSSLNFDSYYSRANGDFVSHTGHMINGTIKGSDLINCTIESSSKSTLASGYLIFNFQSDESNLCLSVNQSAPTVPCSTSQAEQFTVPCDDLDLASDPTGCPNYYLIIEDESKEEVEMYIYTAEGTSPSSTTNFSLNFDTVYLMSSSREPPPLWVVILFIILLSLTFLFILFVFIRLYLISNALSHFSSK